MTSAGCPPLVHALRHTLCGASDEPVDLIETHISCVLLTRDAAYKIKKPVTLPFLDYGTLDAAGSPLDAAQVRRTARV